MKKRILILGSEGMVGHVVTLRLRQMPGDFDVIDVNRGGRFLKPTAQLDITDFKSLEALYNKYSPDAIVNCIGILNQFAEANPADAIQINAYLPHFLESITKGSSCKVIHISTDCVFDGEKGSYLEGDQTTGRDVYAKSKALGELRNQKDLTLRTSLIGPELSPDGIGLFNWFAKSKGTINGYAQTFWTGVTSVEMAKAVIHAIQHDVTGLYHLVNGNKISKLDLLLLFKKEFPGSAVEHIIPSEKEKHDKSLVDTRKDFGFAVTTYEQMIREMRNWMLANRALYPHYEALYD